MLTGPGNRFARAVFSIGVMFGRRAPRAGRRALRLLLALGSASAALETSALPEDRRQAIEITAEQAVRDEKAGYTVYIGDVILQQGSLRIEADRLTVFHHGETPERIVALGEPATMTQQPEVDAGLVSASAREIVYEQSRELVVLRKTANIEQDGALVSGEFIEYFMAEQRVHAAASTSDDARVQVIIPAQLVEARGEREATADQPGAALTAPSPTPAPTALESDLATEPAGNGNSGSS